MEISTNGEKTGGISPHFNQYPEILGMEPNQRCCRGAFSVFRPKVVLVKEKMPSGDFGNPPRKRIDFFAFLGYNFKKISIFSKKMKKVLSFFFCIFKLQFSKFFKIFKKMSHIKFHTGRFLENF